MKRQLKIFVYLVIILICILLAIMYYREPLMNHWLNYNVDDEVIVVSSFIETNADNSNYSKL